MADELDRVVEEAGIGRRAFLRRMLVGTAFATPVVASFAMGGVAAANPRPGSPIAPLLPFCNSNTTVLRTGNVTGGGNFFEQEFLSFTDALCGFKRRP
jgi:hypothetical protein